MYGGINTCGFIMDKRGSEIRSNGLTARYFENCDYPGNDIDMLVVRDNREYFEECMKRVSCSHWSVNWEQICYMKRGLAGKRSGKNLSPDSCLQQVGASIVAADLLYIYFIFLVNDLSICRYISL